MTIFLLPILVVVETRGIEPLSKSVAPQTSPSAVAVLES